MSDYEDHKQRMERRRNFTPKLCNISPESIKDPVKYIETLHKLFWLAANEYVFFTSYDGENNCSSKDGAFPAVNCNDLFYWASADAENIELHEIDEFTDMVYRFGAFGSDAWASVKRNQEPITYRTLEARLRFEEAKKFLLEKKRELEKSKTENGS